VKLPAAIRIGPYKCKVTRTKLEPDADGYSNWGSFDTDTYCVEIAESGEFADEALIASTVVHEIIHAMNHVYGFADDEEMVRKQETALVQILKDNKTLIRQILKALK